MSLFAFILQGRSNLLPRLTSRKSSVTAEAVKDYRDQIKTTTDDLEARLEGIDEKLEAMFKRNAASSASDSSELQLLKEERLSTQNCLQICAQLSDHIDQIRPNSTGSEAMPERVEDLQKCKDSLSRAATMLEGHMHDRIQRFIIKSKTVMTPEEVADLERLRDEWDTARQCVAICSTADSRLKESVSIIENYGTHDETVQFLASTGKTMHSRNRGYGRKMRQVGGHFNDTSVQQLSRDIASISRPDTVDGSLSSPGDASSDAQPAVKDEYEFRERYGEGFNLAPKSTLG